MKGFAEKLRRLLVLRRTLALVWAGGPLWLVANLILLVVQGLLPLVSLYLLKLIVDGVSGAVGTGDPEAFSRIALLIALAGVAGIAGILCRSLAGLVGEAQSQAVTDHVYDVLHSKSLEVDLEYYESPRYYDTLHMAQREAPHRPVAILNSMVRLAQNGISLVAVSVLLFTFHAGLALILFAAVVPGVFVRFRYAGRMYRWQQLNTPKERRANYLNWLLTGDVHAKEVRLFGLGGILRERFRDLRSTLRRDRIALSAGRVFKEFVMETCAVLAIFACLALIAHRAINGTITLGEMVMFFGAFQRGQTFLREMLVSLAAIYENSLFLSNFHRFLQLETKVAEPVRPLPVPASFREGIVFDKVSFRYPGGSRDVLRDVSFAIRPGEHVALVGENGSGKTTLVKLLCRLYDPDGGGITVDGTNLTAFATRELRSRISVIFQDYARYQVSARENIWFGNTELGSDDPRVEESARLSGADNVIRQLPHGYDTMLGKWFAGGEELSVGQWQEIALARAFLRNAQLIVLDEPTSALDARAEHEVLGKFHALARERTAVIISHRMSTVRLADRIVVLEEGRVAETGSHDELMDRAGPYARLFDLQARHYR